MSQSIQPTATARNEQQKQQRLHHLTRTEQSGSDLTEWRRREHKDTSKESEEAHDIEARQERVNARVRPDKEDNPPVGDDTVNRESENNNNVNVNHESATKDEDLSIMTTSSTLRNQTDN